MSELTAHSPTSDCCPGTSKRLNYVDVAKGIAIFLVVLGHVLDHHRGAVGFSAYTDFYVYSFHVPFFFLLSGLVFRVHEDESFYCFFKRKFLRLMVPYYCFGLIAIVVFSLASYSPLHERLVKLNPDTGDARFFQMLWNLLYGTRMEKLFFYKPIWFLSSLFSMQIITYFIIRISSFLELVSGDGLPKHQYARKFSLFSFCLLFISLNVIQFGFLYVELPMGLNGAIKYLPFFLIGLLFQELILQSSCENRTWDSLLSLAFLAIGVIIYICVCKGEYHKVLFTADHDLPVDVCLRYASAFFSSFGFLYLGKSLWDLWFLSLIGRNTLPILVVHNYLVLLTCVMGECSLPDPCLFLLYFLLAFLVTVIALWIGMLILRFFPFLFGQHHPISRSVCL